MIVDANPLVVILQSFKRRVSIDIFDDEETALDPSEISLQVQQIGGAVVYSDNYGTPPPDDTRIQRAGLGSYYIVWGDPLASANLPDNTETRGAGCKYLFVWSVIGAAGTEEVQRVQTVEIISARVADLVREFQDQLDKARKAVSVTPTDFCPLGYTEGWLLQYLRGGLTMINAYQPYPTFCSIEQFPDLFRQVLIDAGLVVGVNAQTLYAIDSDIENYNDSGTSFVINHQPKLAAFSAALSQRLDAIIPSMKRHFVSTGNVTLEQGPNYRLNTLIQMAPNGALFRNFFVR